MTQKGVADRSSRKPFFDRGEAGNVVAETSMSAAFALFVLPWLIMIGVGTAIEGSHFFTLDHFVHYRATFIHPAVGAPLVMGIFIWSMWTYLDLLLSRGVYLSVSGRRLLLRNRIAYPLNDRMIASMKLVGPRRNALEFEAPEGKKARILLILAKEPVAKVVSALNAQIGKVA